ncbi:MAG TPA: N-acetyl sugar amidotransferase [Clostridia bacterium]
MSNREYQICKNCVMDTTDSQIVFDEKGFCDYCSDFYLNIQPNWHPDAQGEQELAKIVEEIKRQGKGKKYDCIIGLSGGTDSSYLTYLAKEKYGLRPLVYVVDTGWNLNVAVENIEKIVKGLDLEMVTEVVNWNEMRDLQLAFFKAQVPYQDLPQDHAIFAGLYNFAVKNKIKYLITGANSATECVIPPYEWVYMNDLKFIKDVHRKFGKVKLKTFPFCSMLKYRVYYRYIKGMTRLAPLNMIPYNKEKTEKELHARFGWQKYENKHYENVFTRFYEGYYLPVKFGFDKRKGYYSSMILAGHMTREQALAELATSPYDKDTMLEDMEYIAKKLGITTDEFQKIIGGENKSFRDYRNSFWFIRLAVRFARLVGVEKRNFR